VKETIRGVAGHYSRGDLRARLVAALADDGVDPRRPDLLALAPYDQFHGRGLEATVELADGLRISGDDHLLDVGSGIGGPARYLAQRFGCRVTGVDITPVFCAVARELTQRLGLAGRVEFVRSDALAMPFDDARFDGAYSMNVSMNISDRAGLYREIGRVLKPGGWLALSEIAKGEGPDIDYPTPWAESARASFLATPDATRECLVEVGFDIVHVRSTRAQALAFGARSRAMVGRGEKPPHRAVTLMHGELAPQAIANMARALEEARVEPIEIRATKRR
jgi:ubiquinone/menaquinone biosynthesis C-methylase UbiE